MTRGSDEPARSRPIEGLLAMTAALLALVALAASAAALWRLL